MTGNTGGWLVMAGLVLSVACGRTGFDDVEGGYTGGAGIGTAGELVAGGGAAAGGSLPIGGTGGVSSAGGSPPFPLGGTGGGLSTGGLPHSAGAGGVLAGGGTGGTPVGDCVGCAIEKCGDVALGCLTSAVCVEGAVCAAMSCGDDVACLLECFGGDLAVALKAVELFSCLAVDCGTACAGSPFADGSGLSPERAWRFVPKHAADGRNVYLDATTAAYLGLEARWLFVPESVVLEDLLSSISGAVRRAPA